MRLSACLALLIGLATTVVAQQPADPVEPPPAPAARVVKVTAEGLNHDDAVKQALRKALEQGAGVQIAAFSQTKNFELVRDTIYSRAGGIVSDFRILDESKGPGGTLIVTIEASVRPDAVARTWGEVQNVLDQIGRPKILISIDETIDGQPQRESIVEARLQEMFVKAGFDVVEGRAAEEIRQREARDADVEKNAAKLARLAKDAGAQIYIRGSANANKAGLENLYGVIAAFYNCDVQARIYYTDTGKLLASESLPVTRYGARSRTEHSPQAARMALVQATFPEEKGRDSSPRLAQRLFESVMEQWSTQISAGSDIALEIENLEFKSFAKIRTALGEIQNVQSVDGEFTKGSGVFRIKARISAATLAERLTEAPFSEYLEVVDFKTNRIQARAVAKP